MEKLVCLSIRAKLDDEFFMSHNFFLLAQQARERQRYAKKRFSCNLKKKM